MERHLERNSEDREFVSSENSSKPLRLLAAQRLLDHKPKIIERWEKEVHSRLTESQEKNSLAISGTLAEFLEELGSALKGDLAIDHVLRGMGKVHGEQRALLSGYYLPQLLKEFSILRWIINQELFEHEVSSFEVETIVNQAIDSAISRAATEFAEIQNHRIRSALKKAEMSNQDLEHFAAIAAHDLKSPLATISGYLDLVEDELKDKVSLEAVRHLQTMSRTAKRMRNLIDRLLDYARLTKVDRPRQPISVLSVLEAACQNLADTVNRTEAKITYGSLPVVSGDMDLLTQLFQNLIGNAIKFHGKEAPHVQIEARFEDGMWLFTIADNGIGFDPKDEEHIFALYKKLHSETEFQGTGIGLATCRKVVEFHGGKIWADSEPGHGSNFYFTLPQISIGPEGYC